MSNFTTGQLVTAANLNALGGLAYGLVRRSVTGQTLTSGTSAAINFNVAEYTFGDNITAVTSGSDRGFDLENGLWLITFKLRLAGTDDATRVQASIHTDGDSNINSVTGLGVTEAAINTATKNLVTTAVTRITTGPVRVTGVGFHNAGTETADTQHSALSVVRLAGI